MVELPVSLNKEDVVQLDVGGHAESFTDSFEDVLHAVLHDKGGTGPPLGKLAEAKVLPAALKSKVARGHRQVVEAVAEVSFGGILIGLDLFENFSDAG